MLIGAAGMRLICQPAVLSFNLPHPVGQESRPCPLPADFQHCFFGVVRFANPAQIAREEKDDRKGTFDSKKQRLVFTCLHYQAESDILRHLMSVKL